MTGGASMQERVRNYVLVHAPQRFTIADVRRSVPGTSDQTIRLVLNELKIADEIEQDGIGRGAGWVRLTGSHLTVSPAP